MTGLTEVALIHLPGRQEHWVRFGRHESERIIDRRRRVLRFRPQQTLAFVRWRSNDHGTIESWIDIVRAVHLDDPAICIPGITPGVESLLRVFGWPNVQQVLGLIDGAELAAGDGADVCPAYWRHVHQRLAARAAPAIYSASRHRAWLLRQAVER
jgi:hypothetical protein